MSHHRAVVAPILGCTLVLAACTWLAAGTTDPTAQGTLAPRKLRILDLSGTPRERGLQHGAQCKEDIARLLPLWKEELRIESKMDPDTLIRDFLAQTDFIPAIQRWTPELLEEVRGIAEGSGQPFDVVFALQLLDEIWVYIDQRAGHHCTGLGVAARQGRPAIVAQNLDLESFRDRYQVVLRVAPTASAPEQLIFTSPGLIAANGMNGRSLAIACNTLMQLRACTDGLPVAFIVRGVLAKRTGEEALRFLRTVKHASGQNYILGCGDRVYDFEASAVSVTPFRPTADERLVYHTNHPLISRDLKPWYQPTAGVQIHDSSHGRLEALQRRLDTATGTLDAEAIKAILRSKDSPAHPICRPVNASDSSATFTFGATVMTLGDHPFIEVSLGPPDLYPFHRIDFRALGGTGK